MLTPLNPPTATKCCGSGREPERSFQRIRASQSLREVGADAKKVRVSFPSPNPRPKMCRMVHFESEIELRLAEAELIQPILARLVVLEE